MEVRTPRQGVYTDCASSHPRAQVNTQSAVKGTMIGCLGTVCLQLRLPQPLICITTCSVIFRLRQVFGYYPTFHTLTSVRRKSTFSMLKICFCYSLQFLSFVVQSISLSIMLTQQGSYCWFSSSTSAPKRIKPSENFSK